MKFQKFPFLVQKQIMEDLTYADVFCLSLTSTRTARITRCLKFVRVSKVLYCQTPFGFDISIEEHEDNKRFPVGSVKIKRSRNFEYLLTTKLGANKVNFECQKNDDTHCQFKNLLFCLDDPEKILPKSMVEHANSLFGQPPVVSLDVYFDASFNVTPVVPSVTELEFSNKQIDAKCVEFMKNNPNLKYLTIYEHWTVEPDFYDIPYLRIYHSDHWTSSILRNFKGKHLELDNAVLGKKDILEFIRKWKANEGYHNYECVDIRTKEKIHQSEKVRREIESAEWNPNQRPGVYEYCFPAYHKQQFAASFYRDIRRDGDNQLASFDIQQKWFTFIVWK